MPRAVPVLVLLAFAIGTVLVDRTRTTAAADGEQITWGATDPSWSPDGKELMVSLFGSIWRMPAEGGLARQVTTTPNVYDAHVAWSPDGRSIALVRGGNLRGRFGKAYGRLVVADAESGETRFVVDSLRTGGTPSWSPDSKKIAIGMMAANGVTLHEVDAATGEARALEGPLQRNTPTMAFRRSLRGLGRWMETAWSADGETIAYAGERQGAPQIWTIPAGDRKYRIAQPLTRYLPDDIINLEGLSALPGGGFVFSADPINTRGNFDLYRTGDDFQPVPLTEHPRHEFSPRVSPDGKQIVFSSNRLGNIDLFVMPADGGKPKHLPISELRFRNSGGKVRVRVVDELGNPTPVRLYNAASDGKAYAPQGDPIWYYPLTPGEESRGFFVGTGDDVFPAPAGNLELIAVKGVEYRVAHSRTRVEAGQTAEVTIQLERWTNWNQRGWYSGENHFHANYLGSYYQRPPDSLAWMKAMDLNAANMIVANAQGAYVHDMEFFTGELSTVSDERHFLWWGQEYRNSDPLGHMGFLNIRRQVPPSYTSVPGSDSPYDFPLNTMAALQAKAQGGLVTYMHPMMGGVRDVFDTNLGGKEAAVTAALGGLDTLDLLPYADPAYELWYTLLNSGVKIAAGAGTDTFTNWRGINRIPGGSRQYIHVGSRMSWERWIERYREGRSFATNGPLVDIEVNGQGMGEEISVPAGRTYQARVSAQVWSATPIDRIEIVRNGRVIATEEVSSQTGQYRLEAQSEVSESSWFAVRVDGPGAEGLADRARAHSSPVYVRVGDQPTLVREDLQTAVDWVDRFWSNLELRDNFGPAPNQARAKEMVDQARAFYVARLAAAPTATR